MSSKRKIRDSGSESDHDLHINEQDNPKGPRRSARISGRSSSETNPSPARANKRTKFPTTRDLNDEKGKINDKLYGNNKFDELSKNNNAKPTGLGKQSTSRSTETQQTQVDPSSVQFESRSVQTHTDQPVSNSQGNLDISDKRSTEGQTEMGIKLTVNAHEDQFCSDSDGDLEMAEVKKVRKRKKSSKRKQEESSDSEEDSSSDSESTSDSDPSSGESSEDEGLLESNPKVAKLLLKLIQKKKKRKQNKKGEQKDRGRDRLKSKKKKKEKGKEEKVPQKSNPRRIYRSLSMDTMYTPALQKVTNIPHNSPIFGKGNPVTPPATNIASTHTQNDAVDRISNFLEKIRLEQRERDRSRNSEDSEGPHAHASHEKSNRDRAEEAVVEAEKFKASIEPPAPGNDSMSSEKAPEGVESGEDLGDDDELFEVAMHVEDVTQGQIAKGGFIEVEKLIAKQESKIDGSEQHSLKLVNRDGVSFLVAGEDKETAIYSKANPHRAAEIWQYIHTISNAANTFHWNNVAYYDYMFRKIMAKRPNRSWAKTHMQLWTTSMKHHLPPGHNAGHPGGAQGGGSHVQKKKDWRDNVCWKYNKNKCQNPKCNFEHRCSYCASYNHIAIHCRKKRKSEESEASSSHSQQGGGKRTGRERGTTTPSTSTSTVTTVSQ